MGPGVIALPEDILHADGGPAPIRPVTPARAALDPAFVEQVRKQNWNASHHCSAYIVGPDRAIEQANDAGEPPGTAGAPMLAVLRGRELTDVVAVVSRWFGCPLSDQ